MAIYKSFLKLKKIILFILRANKKEHIIFLGYSAFQANLITKLKVNHSEFVNIKFLLFDFNRTYIGRNQFKNACKSNKEFITYLGQINTLILVLILVINLLKRINILHGNYNSLSFNLLSLIYPKNLSALDDGSNTLLMLFRIKRKFKNLYTIFPIIKNNQRLVVKTLSRKNKNLGSNRWFARYDKPSKRFSF